MSTFTPCCDPFVTSHKIVKVFPVTEAVIEHAKKRNIKIKLGQFICGPCRNRLKKKVKLTQSSTGQAGASSSSQPVQATPMEIDKTIGPETTSESEKEFDSDDQFDPANIDKIQLKDATNNLLKVLGIEAIDDDKNRRKNYQIEVIKKLTNRLTRTLFPHAQPSNDAEEIIHQLKEKFESTTDPKLKVKILSVLPKNWSISKIRQVFGNTASVRLIRKTKKLVQKEGILCDTTKKLASHEIDGETIELAIKLYQDDEVSRACPGIRDYVRLKSDGGYEKIQRRLIMMDLRDVYDKFKEKYPNRKIGFSKFASIRPKECVLAGSTHGIHRTCICLDHQNVQLIFDTLKSQFKDEFKEHGIETVRDMMNVMLCEQITEKCRMNECKNCPGIDGKDGIGGLRSLLHLIIDDSLYEYISYKQWMKFGSKFLLTYKICLFFF